MAAATIADVDYIPLGPKMKLVSFTVTLTATHTATGDTVDLSSYLPTAVHGAWQIGQSNGYKCDYVRAAAGAPSTGKVHGYYGDWDAVGDGALITAAGQNLSGFSFKMLALGY